MCSLHTQTPYGPPEIQGPPVTRGPQGYPGDPSPSVRGGRVQKLTHLSPAPLRSPLKPHPLRWAVLAMTVIVMALTWWEPITWLVQVQGPGGWRSLSGRRGRTLANHKMSLLQTFEKICLYIQQILGMYMCALHLHIRVCIHMYKKNWKRRWPNIAGILFKGYDHEWSYFLILLYFLNFLWGIHTNVWINLISIKMQASVYLNAG